MRRLLAIGAAVGITLAPVHEVGASGGRECAAYSEYRHVGHGTTQWYAAREYGYGWPYNYRVDLYWGQITSIYYSPNGGLTVTRRWRTCSGGFTTATFSNVSHPRTQPELTSKAWYG